MKVQLTDWPGFMSPVKDTLFSFCSHLIATIILLTKLEVCIDEVSHPMSDHKPDSVHELSYLKRKRTLTLLKITVSH